MNYYAHALPLLDQTPVDEYALAGVAVPDWLGVTARRTKCRTRHARPYADHDDPRLAALARGVVRHHEDDAWFHESRAFAELSLHFARRLRAAFGDASGMRPWFLGHVLVEVLLDDALVAEDPGRLDDYYAAVAKVDASLVADAVERMSGAPVGRLAEFIERFVDVRFLADYADDQRLRFRMNQVLSRVRLPELPPEFDALAPQFREEVRQRCGELMARE